MSSYGHLTPIEHRGKTGRPAIPEFGSFRATMGDILYRSATARQVADFDLFDKGINEAYKQGVYDRLFTNVGDNITEPMKQAISGFGARALSAGQRLFNYSDNDMIRFLADSKDAGEMYMPDGQTMADLLNADMPPAYFDETEKKEWYYLKQKAKEDPVIKDLIDRSSAQARESRLNVLRLARQEGDINIERNYAAATTAIGKAGEFGAQMGAHLFDPVIALSLAYPVGRFTMGKGLTQAPGLAIKQGLKDATPIGLSFPVIGAVEEQRLLDMNEEAHIARAAYMERLLEAPAVFGLRAAASLGIDFTAAFLRRAKMRAGTTPPQPKPKPTEPAPSPAKPAPTDPLAKQVEQPKPPSQRVVSEAADARIQTFTEAINNVRVRRERGDVFTKEEIDEVLTRVNAGVDEANQLKINEVFTKVKGGYQPTPFAVTNDFDRVWALWSTEDLEGLMGTLRSQSMDDVLADISGTPGVTDIKTERHQITFKHNGVEKSVTLDILNNPNLLRPETKAQKKKRVDEYGGDPNEMRTQLGIPDIPNIIQKTARDTAKAVEAQQLGDEVSIATETFASMDQRTSKISNKETLRAVAESKRTRDALDKEAEQTEALLQEAEGKDINPKDIEAAVKERDEAVAALMKQRRELSKEFAKKARMIDEETSLEIQMNRVNDDEFEGEFDIIKAGVAKKEALAKEYRTSFQGDMRPFLDRLEKANMRLAELGARDQLRNPYSVLNEVKARASETEHQINLKQDPQYTDPKVRRYKRGKFKAKTKQLENETTRSEATKDTAEPVEPKIKIEEATEENVAKILSRNDEFRDGQGERLVKEGIYDKDTPVVPVDPNAVIIFDRLETGVSKTGNPVWTLRTFYKSGTGETKKIGKFELEGDHDVMINEAGQIRVRRAYLTTFNPPEPAKTRTKAFLEPKPKPVIGYDVLTIDPQNPHTWNVSEHRYYAHENAAKYLSELEFVVTNATAIREHKYYKPVLSAYSENALTINGELPYFSSGKGYQERQEINANVYACMRG